MTLREIATRLNKLAVENKFEIAKLQFIRCAPHIPRVKSIFTNRTIFDNYAYHYGGRTEAQFNIGNDKNGGADIFRYGLAFSLEAGHSLTTPIETITPYIRAFNEYCRTHFSDFAEMKMWYHYDSKNDRNYDIPRPIGKIPDGWIGYNNFIFVGDYFKKTSEDITESDLKIILELFDRLLPAYRYMHSKVSRPGIILTEPDNKMSKICWNYNNWIKPSGRAGKS